MIWYLPLGMLKTLGMRSWRCGGGEEGGEEGGQIQGAAKLVAAARGLWTALQASVRRMRYLCNARTWGRRSRSRYTVWASLGKVFEL